VSLGEDQQGGCGVELEERQRLFAASSVDALERRHQRCVGNLDSIDDDALVVAKQMRRSERADAIAGLAQDARGERYARTLAVSAGDRDDRARGALPRQAIERALQAIEPEIDRVRMQGFLPGKPVGETA